MNIFHLQNTKEYKKKSFCGYNRSQLYSGRESSTRCNFRKHMQIEKAPANQENIFIIFTADGANAHNTTKYILFALFVFFIVEKSFIYLINF